MPRMNWVWMTTGEISLVEVIGMLLGGALTACAFWVSMYATQ